MDNLVLPQSLKSIGFIFNSLQRESEIGDCSLQIESPSGKLELKLSFPETEIELLQLLGLKCKTQLEKEKRGLKIRQSRNHCTFIRLSLTDNNLDLCPLQRIQPTDQKIPWNSVLETENFYWTKKGRYSANHQSNLLHPSAQRTSNRTSNQEIYPLKCQEQPNIMLSRS